MAGFLEGGEARGEGGEGEAEGEGGCEGFEDAAAGLGERGRVNRCSTRSDGGKGEYGDDFTAYAVAW